MPYFGLHTATLDRLPLFLARREASKACRLPRGWFFSTRRPEIGQ